MEKAFRGLLGLIVLLVVFVVGVQVGIYRGRMLEREMVEKKLEPFVVDAAKVIACESAGKHDGVWGDGGKSYGRFQFQRKTFVYLARLSGIEGLEWKNERHQFILFRWAWENGHAKEWSCYKKIKAGNRKKRATQAVTVSF